MKILVIIVFIAILGSLGSALYHLVKHPDGDESGKTAKMLTVRISLSLVLFILLFIAFASGLFQPQGLGARIEHIRSEKAAGPQP
ncbi:twin transmembrane helix small protein [Methylomonas sp. AM2-LC]|uniref:twin transmembrane helix small protein n=1 Tax=Methylomonas sp. AM2-LC TaxID=3153301 RepID=UPI0032634EA7